MHVDLLNWAGVMWMILSAGEEQFKDDEDYHCDYIIPDSHLIDTENSGIFQDLELFYIDILGLVFW